MPNIYEAISASIRVKYPFLDVYYAEEDTLLSNAANWIYPRHGCGPSPFKLNYYDKYLEIQRCDEPPPIGWFGLADRDAVTKALKSWPSGVIPYCDPIIVHYADPMLMEIIHRELFEHFRLTSKIKKFIGELKCS